jgi:hypothetical protein
MVRRRSTVRFRNGAPADGRAVLNEFTDLKWITVEPSDQPYPF